MRTIRANGEHHLTFICQLVFVACISINTQIASEAKGRESQSLWRVFDCVGISHPCGLYEKFFRLQANHTRKISLDPMRDIVSHILLIYIHSIDNFCN